LDCILVLAGEPPQVPEANTFLDVLLGAELVWTNRAEMKTKLVSVFQEAKAAGRKPYLIPYGGSNATGAAAYAYAIGELIEQGLDVDWVVFASSSGGTQAGMVAGAALYDFQGDVLGISVDEPAESLKARVADLAERTAELLGETREFSAKQIMVNDDYLGKGYAVMGAPEIEAIQMLARLEGLLVDPVYTGRAAAGLIDLIRKGFFTEDESVLFWHTGGSSALFADTYRGDLVK
jgi:1-aminocyclopropane-1-carboxylate deaminase/D-cysteine desulfhydrase-like pyridoxal-dependent ACC family enzyme